MSPPHRSPGPPPGCARSPRPPAPTPAPRRGTQRSPPRRAALTTRRTATGGFGASRVAKYPAVMTETPARPSLLALFLGFLSVGLFGFGGVLPWARRMVVEQRRWMTAAEFTDMLGLCQFLPGGNIMNVTIALGARFHGAAGAATAFVGLMAAPVAIVIALGVIYDRFAELP